MATGATPDRIFWSVYEGCISGYDNCVERRPYHRNCGCALHNKPFNCTHKLQRCNNVSYPMRRAWSEGSLVLANSSSSPSQVATGGRPQ
ncbi:Cyclophilin peptidyl-prolyl cis-trans isomerase family protein isoform 1 [Spatholobus suberectus]|nr:Cyclophilin peptidyl-prolyl cis-trans isomerase family protein isoform 1 [Spatholobus suberectus]